ncbi:MBL fold metallo-hydrolase [Leeuwenhoekiella parthenopeia]|uniref:MBL fold metallo-hydrolase n=1 Tax=Leeuwenhoekiella parthenopeia TaxID=2890320 RepID=A0ABS8GT63_9FLAO|nr:MBL fold metallo-hydrolase [Leeuwenhoekiella parthenopeia]MCC4212996.1 MBL fold metallo-hydrolase [Leeuwenhoekiella parthenopeia]
MFKQFGGKITPQLKKRYAQSPNWKDGKFENSMETGMDFSFKDLPGMLYKLFFQKGNTLPNEDLAILPLDVEAFLEPSKSIKYVWYGHGVFLMRVNGRTLLIDPMFGPDAAPISPFGSKRFSKNTLDLIDTLPPIDLMLLTHDHYDHLDLTSIQKLIPKIKNCYVALGAGRHLEAWGVDAGDITEFDWWDSTNFEGIEITFTPSRHFSGRGLGDRAKSLWGGWVFKTKTESLYLTGDGGYGPHFKEIGERLGPFDFGFIECGQYGEKWRQIHMFPDESITAAQDAQIKTGMPYHWAGFKLALHDWTEPAEEFVKYATQMGFDYTLPGLGELNSLQDSLNKQKWWIALS